MKKPLVTHNEKDKVPKGSKRSNQWPKVRKAFLRDHPNCAVCGGKKKLEVHHKNAFHTHPQLELDPSNLITLCEAKGDGVSCHLLVGHLGNFKSINVNVEKDAEIWNKKILTRP